MRPIQNTMVPDITGTTFGALEAAELRKTALIINDLRDRLKSFTKGNISGEVEELKARTDTEPLSAARRSFTHRLEFRLTPERDDRSTPAAMHYIVRKDTVWVNDNNASEMAGIYELGFDFKDCKVRLIFPDATEKARRLSFYERESTRTKEKETINNYISADGNRDHREECRYREIFNLPNFDEIKRIAMRGDVSIEFEHKSERALNFNTTLEAGDSKQLLDAAFSSARHITTYHQAKQTELKLQRAAEKEQAAVDNARHKAEKIEAAVQRIFG
ncbi:MAG: hypothetical protein J5J00_09765 [Deltaproteobacteria bacterium]|nr:hypothetical protein [Deltaproteobacteria bacterium]